jgi:cobalamin biosynthesis protein CobC
MRERLHKESQRLDELIQGGGLNVRGGTSLFRFVRHPEARRIFETLGRLGVLVRAFDNDPETLRFGQPGGDDEWTRLKVALALWSRP